MRRVYVEAVYNTAQEPVPHEVLWDELQRALAATGRLHLSTANDADIIIRTHLTQSSSGKAGERKSPANNKREPEPDLFSGQREPPGRGQLKDISIADDYFLKTSWSSTIEVEVWDLHTKTLLMRRQYALSGEIPTVRGDIPTEAHHLRNEESFYYGFSNSSRAVAERIVSDLLIR
jgi:hypothetical protein